MKRNEKGQFVKKQSIRDSIAEMIDEGILLVRRGYSSPYLSSKVNGLCVTAEISREGHDLSVKLLISKEVFCLFDEIVSAL